MRDVDAFVARKIMRWTDVQRGALGEWTGIPSGIGTDGEIWRPHQKIPNYSSDLESAWEVVEEMKSRGFLFGITWQRMEGTGPFSWQVTFQQEELGYASGTCNSFTNKTLAICMAAIDSLGLIGYCFDGSSPVRVNPSISLQKHQKV